jgi:hypothetical protein
MNSHFSHIWLFECILIPTVQLYYLLRNDVIVEDIVMKIKRIYYKGNHKKIR